MRFSEVEALEYLRKHDVNVSRDIYYKVIGQVESKVRDRLYEICKNMKERHMARIDEVEIIRKNLWECFREADKVIDKLRALHELRELQGWISAYDEASQGVLEDSIRLFGKEEHIDVSSLFKQS